LCSEFIRCGDHQMTELAGGADANRACGTFRDQQRAQRLHISVAAFGVSACSSRKHRAGGFDRVELVGLTVAAPLLSVRTINLDHGDTGRREMPRQARPVGPGPFHPTRSTVPNEHNHNDNA
jgi:hypothetical protein